MYQWNPFRRIRRNLNQYLLSIICIISIIFICNISNYLYKLYIVDYYENEALDQNTVYFAIHPLEYVDLDFLAEEDIVKDATLLLHAKGSGVYYNVIYSAGNKDVFGGSYFEKSDFSSGNKCAVVGNDVSFDYDNNSILMAEDKYWVKGRMDESVNQTTNYSVFYTEGTLNNIKVTSVFALASRNGRKIENSLERLKNELEERGMDLEVIHFRRAQYTDFINYHLEVIVVLLGMSALLLIMNVVSMIFWMIGKQRKKRVWFMVGLKHIKLRLGLEYIKIYFISYLLGIAIYLFVWNENILGYQTFAISSVIVLFMAVTSLLICGAFHK